MLCSVDTVHHRPSLSTLSCFADKTLLPTFDIAGTLVRFSVLSEKVLLLRIVVSFQRTAAKWSPLVNGNLCDYQQNAGSRNHSYCAGYAQANLEALPPDVPSYLTAAVGPPATASPRRFCSVCGNLSTCVSLIWL